MKFYKQKRTLGVAFRQLGNMLSRCPRALGGYPDTETQRRMGEKDQEGETDRETWKDGKRERERNPVGFSWQRMGYLLNLLIL